MRARNLKPAIFKNELLAVADPIYTVTFEGLWCMADRKGRLEDRPPKIHFEINPGRAFEVTERSLEWLTENGFIQRYEVGGKKIIQVNAFEKHQKPHVNESGSVLPPPPALVPSEHNQGPKDLALTADSLLLTADSREREEGALSFDIPECPKDMDRKAEGAAFVEYYREDGKKPTQRLWVNWVLRAAKSGLYRKRTARPTEAECLEERRRIIARQEAG